MSPNDDKKYDWKVSLGRDVLEAHGGFDAFTDRLEEIKKEYPNYNSSDRRYVLLERFGNKERKRLAKITPQKSLQERLADYKAAKATRIVENNGFIDPKTAISANDPAYKVKLKAADMTEGSKGVGYAEAQQRLAKITPSVAYNENDVQFVKNEQILASQDTKLANAASMGGIDPQYEIPEEGLLTQPTRAQLSPEQQKIAAAAAADYAELTDNIPSRTKLSREEFQTLQEQHKAFGQRMQGLRKTNPGAFNKFQAQYALEAAHVRNYEFGLQTQEMHAAETRLGELDIGELETSLKDMPKNKADELRSAAMKEREQLLETIRTGRGAAANRLEGNIQNIRNMLKEGVGADGKALTAAKRAGYERAVRQGEAKAAMFKRVASGAEKASGLGAKGRIAMALVGGLATTAIAGLMFRGGKQENAQLYNPNAAFQYA